MRMKQFILEQKEKAVKTCVNLFRAGLGYRDTGKLPGGPVCVRAAMATNSF